MKCKKRERFNYKIDDKFIKYFDKRLKQIFFYITDDCQLRCKQCLYKPSLVFQMKRKEIGLGELKKLAADFKKLGAIKATIMGGEPALYGDPKHKQLMELIKDMRDMGYKYIRMDTNGQYEDDFLANKGMKLLDEISFSIDGYSRETNDILRGEGAFEKVIKNIKRAVNLGYNVDITTCVHSALIKRDDNGELGLDKMIKFTEKLGAEKINFHVLFKHGFPMDVWTEETAIKWKEWVKIYKEINNNIAEGKYKIHVRNPQHFVTKEGFFKNPNYYGYCAAKLGERVLVHSDGMIRICSGLVSSKYCVAKFYDKKIVWEEGLTNELLDHNLSALTPCTSQLKGMKCGNLLPLCFSFKPKQREIVWGEAIKWEDKLDK